MQIKFFKQFEESGADFSEDRKYRYRLWRIWDKKLPLAMCIGLNPSKASEHENDNTINILIMVLKRLGYGGFYMMNCWPYITSNPTLLQTNKMTDGLNNDIMTVTARLCETVIFCWGNFAIVKEKSRDKQLLMEYPSAKCFGKNQNGSPFHPRALSYKKLLHTAQLIYFQ